MYCPNCGYPILPDSRFCEHCGATIKTEAPPPAASPASAPAPQWVMAGGAPYSSAGNSIPGKKARIAALLLGILSVLLAVMLILTTTGVAGAIFAPQQRTFKDPEDAIRFLISHVKANDYNGALSACAIQKAAQNYDFQAYMDWQKFFSPISQELPSKYGLYEADNEAALKRLIMKQLTMMALSVTMPSKYAGALSGQPVIDSADLSDVADYVNPEKFFGIEIIQVGTPKVLGGEQGQKSMKVLAKTYGADEATSRAVLYKVNGDYYTGGVILLRYGEGWTIFSLVDARIGQPNTGALMRVDGESDFRDILSGDYIAPQNTGAETTPEVTAEVTAAPTETPAPTGTPEPAIADDTPINLYSFTNEVPNMLDRYLQLHPDFPYKINPVITATTDGLYEPALDQALASGSVDMYCVESAFAQKYTQFDMASFAMPYMDLGIDVSNELAAAQIAQYTIDIGTRPSDGKLVGLGYQATGGALIYRRSIAKATWGTDDPTAIAAKVGPGWTKFFSAAADLKKKGYAVVSGDGDIWHSVENSAEKGWVVDGKLYIDPAREAFLDLSKELRAKGYSNDTQDWTDAWYADMKGTGKKPVFSFFGPAWMINYVMANQSGGTKPGEGTYGDWAVCAPPAGFFWGGTWVLADNDTLSSNTGKKAAVGTLINWITLDCTRDGLQYAWANGTWNGAQGTKDTVTSGTVMAMADGTLDFLGGQNMFDAFLPANQTANGRNLTQYDGTIDTIWRDQVQRYASGQCTRDQAIAAFRQNVMSQLAIAS